MNVSQLPPGFRERMQESLGAEFELFIASHGKPAPVSVRKNPFKNSSMFVNYEKVSWASGAFYLPERISFTLDPLFHAGCYYVQEASSMFLEQVFKLAPGNKPIKVLDLCAAPGGKSTHLLSMLPEGSLLVSNEVVPSRNKILRHNIVKWGSANVIVTQNEAADFKLLKGFFDVIVVDAPCSGEGLFRKDPEAVKEWNEENVSRCVVRQHDILRDISPALSKDGILIYSTCTYNEQENDLEISSIAASGNFEPFSIGTLPDGVVETKYGAQFFPHRIKGEGFYIAALRKTGDEERIFPRNMNIYSSEFNKYLNNRIDNDNEYSIYENNGELYAIPGTIATDFAFIKSCLFVRTAGIHLGSLKRDEIIPSHRLALSTAVSHKIPRIDVDHDNAIRYLRCEQMNISVEEKGWHLVTYSGHILGWVKNLGNRMNNYFPKEYRILTKG